MAELFNLNYDTYKAAQDLRIVIEEFGVFLKQLDTTGEAERMESKEELLNTIQYEFYELLKEKGFSY